MAVAFAGSDVRPAVAAILSEMGFHVGVPPDSGVQRLSLEGLPRLATELVRKLQRAGLEVQLLDLTASTGIPTIHCMIIDSQAPLTALNAHSGCGTHPDARIAVMRALTEAAQTRMSFIQGGREDLTEMAPNRGTPTTSPPLAIGRTIGFDELPFHQHATINEDVEFMLERLRQCGFEQVVVVDVTKTEIGIPVVRIVVPQAETWTFFYMHSGRASVGRRVLDQIQAIR
jgi:ribosomal protein S12 methylthiotransferase accessory factor